MAIGENIGVPRVKGLSVFEDGDDTYYYTNATLLQHGVFISLSDFYFGENDEQTTWINIVHLSDIDACTYTIYSDRYLSIIQQYGIIKDVFELLQDNELSDSLKLIRIMSGMHQSASMQSNAESRENIMNNARHEFSLVKQLFEQESK